MAIIFGDRKGKLMDSLHHPAAQAPDRVRLDGRFFAEQAADALWAYFLPIRMVARAISLTSRPFDRTRREGRARHLPAE